MLHHPHVYGSSLHLEAGAVIQQCGDGVWLSRGFKHLNIFKQQGHTDLPAIIQKCKEGSPVI